MRPAVAVAHDTATLPARRLSPTCSTTSGDDCPASTSSAWVELVAPGLDEVMSGMGRPAVVVAILLSTGYHVTTDVPAAAALSRAPVLVAASARTAISREPRRRG